MSVFLTGDIHGTADIGKVEDFSRVAEGRLSRDDFLIVLGDFGLVWGNPPRPDETRRLDWLESRPWTTLFIDGNHENFDLLGRLPVRKWHGGRVHVVRPHVLHLMRGEAFEIGGHSVFAAGGAHSADIKWRTPGTSWWPQEVPDAEERERIEAHAREVGQVELLLTHCPPTGQYLRYKRLFPRFWGPTDEYTDWLEGHLEGTLGYRRWFYGHIHLDFPLDEPHTSLFNTVFDLDGTGLVTFGTNMGRCPDGRPHEYEYRFELPERTRGRTNGHSRHRDRGRAYYRCRLCGKELDVA